MKQVTAGILRDEHGRVLLCRRAVGQNHAGDWEFPGGKLEEAESYKNCLARELAEELGIQAQVGEIIIESEYHYSKGSILLVAMQVVSWSGELVLHVHDELAWVEPNNLLDYALSAADIPVAHKLTNM